MSNTNTPGSDPRLLINIFGGERTMKRQLITSVEVDPNFLQEDPSDMVQIMIRTNQGKAFRIQVDTLTPFAYLLNIEFRQPGDQHTTQNQIDKE